METLKQAIMTRFQKSQNGDAYEELITLKQDSIVAEYREKFKLLSGPLQNIPEELLLGTFINGLQEEIRAEVRLLEAQNLTQAMSLALMY